MSKQEANERFSRLVQTRLNQRGAGLTVDGWAGGTTEEALDKYFYDLKDEDVEIIKPIISVNKVDDRSEKVIAKLHPKLADKARQLVQLAANKNITIKLISGLRTFEEQDALYAQGRTTAGSVVTNARGGFSNHNFGLAFDVGVFNGAAYIPESSHYKTVGELGKSLGFEWGGDWTKIKDYPHFQLRPDWAVGMSESQMLTTLRNRRDSGKDYFA